MADALEELQQKNKSLRQIAKEYGVPVPTLHRHATGKTTSTSIGRQPYLTREAEARIAKNVLAWHDTGMSLTLCQLESFALHVVKELQPGSSLVKNWTAKGVSAKWTKGFLGRHPDISVRFADNLDHKRRNVTGAQIEHFYNLTAQVCTDGTAMYVASGFENNTACSSALHAPLQVNAKYGPFPPERILNLDETNLQPQGRQRSVLCQRGAWHAHTAGNANRDSVTILPCVSAAGKALPPLIIAKGALLTAPRFMAALDKKLKGTSWEKSRMICQVGYTFDGAQQASHASPCKMSMMACIMTAVKQA